MLFLLSDLKVDQNYSKRVQLAKVGTFDHAIYGKFSITLADLQKMEKYFNENARRQSFETGPVFPIDYSHEDEKKSAGWGHKVYIDTDKTGTAALFSEVEWTPSGAEAIRNKEFKFISPDIQRNYKDAESGTIYDIVLRGAGLTNIPFLRDMEAVNLLDEKRQEAFRSLKLSGDKPDFSKLQDGVNQMPIEELKKQISALSPGDKKIIYDMLAKDFKPQQMDENVKLSEKVTEQETTIKDLESKLEKSESEKKLTLSESEQVIEKLQKDVMSLTENQIKTEKKAAFDLMLSEGKVCEAQRDAYMANDMVDFAAKQQPIKLSETGVNDNKDSNGDVAEKVMKLANKKMEADKDLELSEAVSLVLSENKALAAEYEG